MNGTIGEVRLYAGSKAPTNWVFCEGQTYSIGANEALFMVLGTFFGGDGVESFCLPDLRGRVVVGPGVLQTAEPIQDFGLGKHGGQQEQMIEPEQVPTQGTGTAADTVEGSGDSLQMGEAQAQKPLSVMQPYMPINYIICVDGLFPQRN